MTNCRSMLDAFSKGGDFHSRTAMSMYPEIKQAVDKGEVLLEWDTTQGTAPVPLLKSKYAAERKTAKTMNFSIAYGKTAHGFAKDWLCSIEEAQAALRRWYADRREVEAWQIAVKNTAITKGYTRTLLGRYRRLTDLIVIKAKRSHGLRAAINTPIQGGAADIVTAAMVRLHYDSELKRLGWTLLMQIHDEVILEGPDESASVALERVKDLMTHPLDEPLRLTLEVDAKVAKTWYDAK
jgi:DNA polymerase-1